MTAHNNRPSPILFVVVAVDIAIVVASICSGVTKATPLACRGTRAIEFLACDASHN